nr:MAG TPA: SPP1 phage holin [Caudoviricetes sp.]
MFLIFISSFVFDFYFWWKNCRGQASLRRLSPVFPIIDPPYKIVVLKKIKIFDII